MKRIISLITAIIMCISCLPAVQIFAAAPEYTHDPTKDVVYNITLGAFDTSALGKIAENSSTNEKNYFDGNKIINDGFGKVHWDAVNSAGTKLMVLSDESAPWAIDFTNISSWSPTNADRITSDVMRIDFNNSGYYANGYSAESTAETVAPYFVLRIYVPNKGKYNISLSGTTASKGGVADVYFSKAEKDFYGPADIAGLKNTSTLLGSYNSKTPGLKTENIELENDEYVFLFIPNVASKDLDAANARNHLSEIRLTPIIPVSDDFEYTISETKVVKYNLTLGAFDKTLLDTSVGYDGSKITKDGFSKIHWNAVNSDGKKIMTLSEASAPWAIDYTALSAHRSATRIADTFTRVDFTNGNTSSTGETFYNNGFTGDKATTRPYFILRTYVPNDGRFNIKITGTTSRDGGAADVYLAKSEKDFYGPDDVEDIVKNSDSLGVFDNTGTAVLSAELRDFEAGEYVFIFVPNEKSKAKTDDKARLLLSEISLTPVFGFGSAKLSLSESNVTTGSYVYPSVEVFDEQGIPCVFEYAEITYSLDRESEKVVYVDEKTGEIYAKRPGTANITVTVKDDRTTVSGTAQLEVKERFVATELPESIAASFPLGGVELGTFSRLKITDGNGNLLGDGIEYKYEISDKSVMSEKDGTFTGEKLGKTDITVIAKLDGNEVKTTITAAVVGENLFTRDGVRHGDFENNVYIAGEQPGASTKGETLWNAGKNLDDDIYTYTFFKNIVSDITGKRTNVVKATVDDTPSDSGKTSRVFRIESGTTPSNATLLENGKIYEYSGFVKLENAVTVPKIQIRQQIYKVSDGVEIEKDRVDLYPFESAQGAFPWTAFTVGPFYANWDEPVVARSKVQASVTDAPYGYDFFVSHLALREVAFENVDFTVTGNFENAKTYDTFATTAYPMSSTGAKIFVGNTGVEIKVNYSSSNPVVAKVDASGVITAVSDGDCEIYADITLGDVTQRGVIPVHLEGLEVKFESIELSADTELKTGDTSEIKIKYFNTDRSKYDGSGITHYYESKNPTVASVSQNGVITAHNPGTAEIFVYASLGGYTAKSSIKVTITDDTPLSSAYIEGADKVEVGFKSKLVAGAVHESGAKADMTGRKYSFALKNPEDKAILAITPDGTVEGIAEGEATVILTVENPDGEPLTAEHTVKVVQGQAKRKIFDFRIHVTNTSILNATVEKYGWQVNRAETSPTRIAEGEAGTFGRLRFLAHAIQFRTEAANTIESDLTLDLLVDYQGWYNISFVGARRVSGGQAIIYVNDEYSGVCDFSSPDDDSNSNFTVELNPVYLKKGLNTFTIRGTTTGKYHYPARITLDYIGEEAPVPQSAAIDVGETTVPFGSVLDATVTALMSTGDTYTFGLDRGFIVNDEKKYTLSSSNSSVVKVAENGKLEAVGEGTARITAEVVYGDHSFSPYVDITVTPKGFTTVSLTAEKTVMAPNGEGSALTVKALDNLGDEMAISAGTEIIYHSSDESVVSVDENGYMTPIKQGSAKISATLTLNEITITGTLNVSVRHGKIKSTYYTDDKIEAVRENINKYKWAKDEKKTVVAEADKYLPHLDFLYGMVHSQDIPRGYLVGFFDDPDMFYCRYCGENIYGYNKYPWQADALNRPWKIQCPDCKRLFPSNDFESLYELVTENNHGVYNIQLAHELNEKIKQETNGQTDYLKNVLYPEIGDQVTVANGGKPEVNVTINAGKGLRPGETVEGWGVDDGLGYMPKKPDGTRYMYDNGVPEVHSYISTFAHIALWDSPSGGKMSVPVIRDAVQSFRDAYLYTGDEKYGRAGVILLDRIADFYPSYDMREFGYDKELGIVTYQNTGGSGCGKIIGNIWEAGDFTGMFATAYDAFFDLYDDPQVIEYLSKKAEKFNLTDKLVADENSGEVRVTGETLRKNVETGILEEILPAVKRGDIAGNFGFKQNTLAKAAVVLDAQPKTQEIIDFIMAPGETDIDLKNSKSVCTGGNVMPQIINIVDRDGVGNESSIGYNTIWASNLLAMAQTLGDYEDVALEDDLLANPKYIKMLQLELVAKTPTRTANIGDAGGALSASYSFTNDLYIAALDSIDKWNASDEFKEEKRTLFSQILYLNNGGTTDGIHYDVFTKDPESLQKNIESVIDEHGEYNRAQSRLTTGYGFAVLSTGVNFTGETLSSNIDNTWRDFFIYFGGGNTSHHHYDGLNLGMDAYGIDMASDLGYPAVTGGRSNHVRTEWIAGTVSHNTVVVNDDRQMKTNYAGGPLHFDDSGDIKVMDIDMPSVYPRYVDTYRRTIVSVDVDDTVSYGIDFFRIIGGDEHVYSFHSRAFEAELDDKIKTVKQPIGTYAGADVPYGDVAYSEKSDSGYNWLENVHRAANPQTGRFWMDFDVEKVTKVQVTEQDWHLRMTMLNDFNLSEIALADGYGPQYGGNPETPFRYVLARRSGKNLDTLFTTVLEPYVGESNIKSLERVPVTKNGNPVKESDGVAAVRVTLNNGRVDYVVYATDNTETYRVDDLFDFSGFIGVYTVTENDADNYVRSYLLDGTKVGNTEATATVSGKVTGFTKELAFENFVDIELDFAIENCDELVGNLLVVENDGQQNGAYVIKSAEVSGNTLRIGVGDVTFIRSFVDSFDTSKGYYYNIKEGQNAYVALSKYETSAPSIEQITDKSVSAGSSITIPITATSDYGRDITFVGTTLPRGMSINQKTGILTWKPDASQVGDNHVAITADDGILTSTVRFTVTVYGSTTGGSSSDTTDTPSTGTTDTPVTGGGGGGGAAPTDKLDDATTNDKADATDENDSDNVPGQVDEGNGGSNATQFTDLSNHTWASDAINSLAAEGIIKGTREKTFSPGNNITRADFALLLVRAFGLTSDNTENFADVSAVDYFASELAIARNNGIISGIGDNKFAPRNTITRQDMMVIVYRALQNLNVGLGDFDEPDYVDFVAVADYAKDAVSALISNGLVNGKSGLIAPLDYTTRAEVAVLIKRVLEYTKK